MHYIINLRGDNMATKRVRVNMREYKMIEKMAEKEDITYSEAVHKLIDGNYTIEDGELVGQSNPGFFLGVIAGAGLNFLGQKLTNKEE